MVFKTISMFWTAVHFFFTCHAWLKLWTVNLYVVNITTKSSGVVTH